MNPDAIVETCDVLENSFSGLLTSFEFFKVNEFSFQNAVKGFNTRVVVTIPFAVHATDHVILFQPSLIIWEAYWLPRSE